MPPCSQWGCKNECPEEDDFYCVECDNLFCFKHLQETEHTWCGPVCEQCADELEWAREVDQELEIERALQELRDSVPDSQD